MLKIFLAEDEVIVRETIKRMIPWEELGFELPKPNEKKGKYNNRKMVFDE